MVSSAVDLTLVRVLAANGVLMAPLSIAILADLSAAAIAPALALVLDRMKVALFERLGIA